MWKKNYSYIEEKSEEPYIFKKHTKNKNVKKFTQKKRQRKRKSKWMSAKWQPHKKEFFYALLNYKISQLWTYFTFHF